jgi:uncharacterized protein
MRGWEFLKKHEVEFNILCTVHAANGDHPVTVYRFFRDELGAQFVQFIPIIERATPDMLPLANKGWGRTEDGTRPLYLQDGHMVTGRSIRPKQFGSFLIGVFEEWVRRDVGTVYVQMFDTSLANWYGEPPGLCIFQETCGLALALEHNGDLYSCDHFVEPDYLLGNIQDTHMIELVSSEQQRQFGLDKRDKLPRYCRECEVRFACNGGCPKNRFYKTPDDEPGLNYLCAGYISFFRHTYQPMRLMASLLQQNRAPAEIMHILANEELQRLREAFANSKPNDICPCGSGQRFKNCHGKNS